jgi:anthranilate phosphoribosyltransferase
MNAGAAIYVAGLVISLEAGIQTAAQMIDEGKALATLLALQAR